MTIPQYKNNKPSETDYAHDTKVVYCKKKLQDRYNQLTLKDFINNFPQMLKDVDFEWRHKCPDGSPRYPSYKQVANHWFKPHKWEECSETYCNTKTEQNKKKASQVYDKGLLDDTITDFKKIDRLNQRHEVLEEIENASGEDQTYRKAKIEEEINSIWHRIRERLDLDKEDPKTNETIIVPISPEHEEQTIRDIWTERARQDVMPR